MSDLRQIDAKMVQKRSTVPGAVPTIPISDDHTDGSWTDDDVYSAELYINEPDKKVFIRIAATIYEFGLVGGGIKKDTFNVGAGGQTIFTTSAAILGDYEVFEDGVITTRGHSKTDTNEITITSTVPEGTIIKIIF